MQDASSEYLSLCANASDNSTSDLWILPDKTSGQVSAAFLLLFFVLGLPWNLLVVVTIVKQRLYTQPSIILLLNLVITDLMLIVLHLPFLITVGLSGEYAFGETDAVRCTTCKVGVVRQIFTLNSLFAITLISFDRFLFIYKPLKYDLYITSCRILLVLCVAWIVAILVPLIPLFGYGDIVIVYNFLSCATNLSFGYSLIILTFSIVPIIFLSVFNIWVCCIVQKNIRAIYKVRKLQTPSSKTLQTVYESMKKTYQQKELHLIRVFGALLCSNIITWLPLVFIAFLLFLGVSVPGASVTAAYILFLSQVLLHPTVELGLIQDVREPLLRWLFCCCLRLKSRRHRPSSLPCGCLELCSTAFSDCRHPSTTNK